MKAPLRNEMSQASDYLQAPLKKGQPQGGLKARDQRLRNMNYAAGSGSNLDIRKGQNMSSILNHNLVKV